MKKKHKMSIVIICASVFSMVLFQNFSKEDWKLKEFAKEGGITVEGSTSTFEEFFLEGSSVLPPMDYSQLASDPANDEIVVVANTACQQAQNALKDAAKQSENEEIVVVGELHGDIDSQYGDILDSLYSAGDCLALEAPDEATVLGSDHAGWVGAIQQARSRGMSVHFIDSAYGTYYTAVMSSSLSDADKESTLNRLMTSVDGANRRDSEMAANLNSLRGSCGRVISLNGRNHVFDGYDSREGRRNLMANLAQLGGAKAIDASNLNECER